MLGAGCTEAWRKEKSLTGRSVSVEQGERRGDKLDLEEPPQRALETIKDKQLLLPWRSGLNLKIKSDTVSTVSPSISHEVMGPDAMIFVF